MNRQLKPATIAKVARDFLVNVRPSTSPGTEYSLAFRGRRPSPGRVFGWMNIPAEPTNTLQWTDARTSRATNVALTGTFIWPRSLKEARGMFLRINDAIERHCDLRYESSKEQADYIEQLERDLRATEEAVEQWEAKYHQLRSVLIDALAAWSEGDQDRVREVVREGE